MLTDLANWLKDRTGFDLAAQSCPIPAGHLATFLNECLVTPARQDRPCIDEILSSIETTYSNQLNAEHWQLVRTAAINHPRYFLHSSVFSEWRSSALELRRVTTRQPFTQGVSLGLFCHAATVLRDMGLRQQSGPFDWIFFSLPALQHALNDDFLIFLDASQCEPVPPEMRLVPTANRAHHRFYREQFGVQFMFNHHDLTQADDRLHYEKAVHGFREVCYRQSPVLFLIMSQHDLPRESLQAVASLVRRNSPHHHVLALQIKQLEGSETTLAPPTVCYQVEGLTVCNFPVCSASNGTVFAHAEDNARLAAWLRIAFFE